MDQEFVNYIKEPSLEHFLTLRRALFLIPGFNPYSRKLESADRLFQEENFTEAERFIRGCISPDYLISPSAHLKLSLVYHRLGREEESERERVIAFRCLDGILLTGDGSAQAPFLVTRPSDEYDVILFHQLKVVSQSLHEVGDHRYDRLETDEGREFWFDITDCFAQMRTLLESGQSPTV